MSNLRGFLGKRTLIRLLLTPVLLLAAYLSVLLAKHAPDFLFPAYTLFSRRCMTALAWITSLCPSSLAEILLFLIPAALLALLIVLLIAVIRRKKKPVVLLRFFLSVLFGASCLVFAFYALWGLNYYAPSLAQTMNLDIKPRSAEELYQVTSIIAKELNGLSVKIDRNDDLTAHLPSFSEAAKATAEAFRAYSGISAPRVKRVLLSVPLSYTQTTGIFIPFTGESNINANDLTADLPYVMAHELSHRYGIAPEDEANFLAFIVLYKNGNLFCRYSALFSAYQYCASKLYDADKKLYDTVASTLNSGVRADLIYYSQYWDQYKGKVAEVTQSVNNAYLNTQGQTEGIQSYGNMVDLVLAYYLKK